MTDDIMLVLRQTRSGRKANHRNYIEDRKASFYAREAEGGTIGWTALAEDLFKKGFRTVRGTMIGPGVLAQAWWRIKQADEKATLIGPKSVGKQKEVRKSGAMIGRTAPVMGQFELRTMGKKPDRTS